MHTVCYRGACNVFWSLWQRHTTEQKHNVCLHADKRGWNAAHYAVKCLVRAKKPSDIYQNIIQPLADVCGDAFTRTDNNNSTPLRMLSESHTSFSVYYTMLCRQLSQSSTVASDSAGGGCAGFSRASFGLNHNQRQEEWHEKLRSELEFENWSTHGLEAGFDGYAEEEEKDVIFESFDDWVERIRREYISIHSRNVPSVRPKHKRSPKQDTNHTPCESNLDDRHRKLVESNQSDLSASGSVMTSFCQLQQRLASAADPTLSDRRLIAEREFDVLTLLAPSCDVTAQLVESIVAAAAVAPPSDRILISQPTNQCGAIKRKVIRDLLRVWHPDKFISRVLPFVAPECNVETLRSNTNMFVQHLNSLL